MAYIFSRASVVLVEGGKACEENDVGLAFSGGSLDFHSLQVFVECTPLCSF